VFPGNELIIYIDGVVVNRTIVSPNGTWMMVLSRDLFTNERVSVQGNNPDGSSFVTSATVISDGLGNTAPAGPALPPLAVLPLQPGQRVVSGVSLTANTLVFVYVNEKFQAVSKANADGSFSAELDEGLVSGDLVHAVILVNGAQIESQRMLVGQLPATTATTMPTTPATTVGVNDTTAATFVTSVTEPAAVVVVEEEEESGKGRDAFTGDLGFYGFIAVVASCVLFLLLLVLGYKKWKAYKMNPEKSEKPKSPNSPNSPLSPPGILSPGGTSKAIPFLGAASGRFTRSKPTLLDLDPPEKPKSILKVPTPDVTAPNDSTHNDTAVTKAASPLSPDSHHSLSPSEVKRDKSSLRLDREARVRRDLRILQNPEEKEVHGPRLEKQRSQYRSFLERQNTLAELKAQKSNTSFFDLFHRQSSKASMDSRSQKSSTSRVSPDIGDNSSTTSKARSKNSDLHLDIPFPIPLLEKKKAEEAQMTASASVSFFDSNLGGVPISPLRPPAEPDTPLKNLGRVVAISTTISPGGSHTSFSATPPSVTFAPLRWDQMRVPVCNAPMSLMQCPRVTVMIDECSVATWSINVTSLCHGNAHG